MSHTFYFKVFNSYDAKDIDDFSAMVVGKVSPPKGDSFMQAGYYLSPASTAISAFFSFRQLTLNFSQSLLFLAEKLWRISRTFQLVVRTTR